jgi:undecaprenyl diphosphate synthase
MGTVKIPEGLKHIAIIMDGNGRWAKKRLMPRTFGHSVGSETFTKIVDTCNESGLEYLTVYALSTENWNRSDEEIGGLLKIMHAYIKKYVPELKKRNIRLKLFGDLSLFDEKSREKLKESEEALKDNTGMCLGICVSYGGRDEIVNAARKLIAQGNTNITEADFEAALYTGGVPSPDLVIRTGGEKRISNFLLWQSAYAEYHFTDILWPDFNDEALAAALEDYSGRKRRYGKEK